MNWDNYVEKKISKHAVFSIIKPIVDSSYQYDMNVMEAVCLGMPVVTTEKRQDYQKYVINGYNGFQAKNSKEFLSKCNEIASDYSIYKEFKKNAISHIESIKNTMPEQYENVYLRLL